MNNTDNVKVNNSFHQNSLLQSKKIVSGEICKEPFLDILVTDLEQSSFSLLLHETTVNRVNFGHLNIALDSVNGLMNDVPVRLNKNYVMPNCRLKKNRTFCYGIIWSLLLPYLNRFYQSNQQKEVKLTTDNTKAIKKRIIKLKLNKKQLFFVRSSFVQPLKTNGYLFDEVRLLTGTKFIPMPYKNYVFVYRRFGKDSALQKNCVFLYGNHLHRHASLLLARTYSKAEDFLKALSDSTMASNFVLEAKLEQKKSSFSDIEGSFQQTSYQNQVRCQWQPLTKACLLKIGDYVHCGDKIGDFDGNPIVISESGKILKISQTQITVQKMQPVLFYSQAEIHVENNEWVKRGTPLLTLAHQTLVTGDIVQGIPRIEQLFEASTSAPLGTALQDFDSHEDYFSKQSSIDEYLKLQHTFGKNETFESKGSNTTCNQDVVSSNNSVHLGTEEKPVFLYKTLQSQVRETFRKKWDQLPLPVAVRQSLEEIQQIIVESIQKVYLSQGVLIADKHIEIIVRQMTSKAQIFDGGSTGLLIDEILSLQQIENANISTPGQKAIYLPVVMGLTRAALSSDSFVSAASFQETTRVLSRDAVAGKTDFLRGLKEKVIIGDLIDAGTGLDAFYMYSLFSKKVFENKFRDILNRKVTHQTLKKLVLKVAK